MPRQVVLYRIFVASPSDCRKERQLVRELVTDWNAVHGFARGLFLEPVLWETHAQPELGDRPQALINRQLIASCDALIGIFRERLGSPSGIAPSGTVEEVSLFRDAGKPVLLYFYTPSGAASAPTGTDIRLEAYRREVGASGLVWPYRGLLEFTRAAAKHLAMTMTTLSGTPPTEATHAEDAASTEPTQFIAGSPPLAALSSLRSETYFVWRGLENLPPDQTEFSCDIRQVTLEKVRGALDALVNEGCLNYSTEIAYMTSFDEMPVMTISIKDVSANLRILISELVQQLGPRTIGDA